MNRPLKILHVCPRPSFSGLEAYAFSMAESQKQLGHEIRFVTLEGSPLEEKVVKAGFQNHSVKLGALGKTAFSFELSRLLTGSDRPDILHLHSTQDINMSLPAMVLSRGMPGPRTKVILQIHIWISHSKKDPLHAIAYSLIDEVWCSSEPAKATLERYLPIAPKKLRIVRYGRKIEAISKGMLGRPEARRILNIPEDAVVLGNVARIDEGKGTRELIEAVIPLLEKHPKLHLVWIGPPTSDDPKAVAFGKHVHEMLNSLPAELKPRMRFPGAIPDSFKLMKAFDLFVLPTYNECFALSLLEAQLASLPALGTASGGTPEVVVTGKTGWLFEPRSTESCQSAIEQALQERDRWEHYGSAAETTVRNDYDFDRILPETILVYRSLLD